MFLKSLPVFLGVMLLSSYVFALVIELDATPTPKPTPKKINMSLLVLDARPRFDFVMEHFSGSRPIKWEDYSQLETPFRGLLDPDNGLNARKLRVLGISRDREVVVIGSGSKGLGEEGRIAWMLRYLGVKKIRMTSFESYKNANKKLKRVSGDHDPDESAAPWIPEVKEEIRIRKNELQKIVENKSDDFVVVDVRDSSDFNNGKNPPIKGAINIPWTKFINDASDPMGSDNVKRIIGEVGLKPNKTFVIYSVKGVRSAYVTQVMLDSGLNARNYDGGLMEWNSK